jgi:uncharacterized protein
MENKNTLIILSKYPELGKVKTRLAAQTSDDFAFKCFDKMFEHHISTYSNLNSISTVVYLAQEEKLSDFKTRFNSTCFSKLQSSGDLGEKLKNAVNAEFENGANKVIVIGTDCPSLMPSDINNALTLLNDNDVAIGPSEDGGYYLIGLKDSTLTNTLFSEINWSTDSVFKETVSKVRKENKSYEKLRVLYDIDTKVEYEKYCKNEKGDNICHLIKLE